MDLASREGGASRAECLEKIAGRRKFAVLLKLFRRPRKPIKIFNMKIERTSSISSPSVKRGERSQKAASGKFAKQVGGQELSSDPVSGAVPVQGVDALLAVQEVEDSTTGGRNARARKWGGEVLDRLEAIRLGLLAGGIPANELQNIANLVTTQRETVNDPRLQEILDEIELRARVELAKYERNR